MFGLLLPLHQTTGVFAQVVNLQNTKAVFLIGLTSALIFCRKERIFYGC